MNFERGIDPKHSMNIGKKAPIIKWFSDLGIDESRYEILPDFSIKMGGYLNLSNTQITSLPDNLSVGGDLNLSNTPITTLPDNLTVGGWLDLSNTSITSLPDNLTVGGWLDLSNTPITSLPDNLSVGWNLNLSNTPITSLPDNLSVGGSLDLENTPITSLPDNISVGGSLYLSNTSITSLPDNLTVGGNLNLSNTPITSLPPSLKVRGQIIGFKGKIVKESLNFKRGVGPIKAMDIGLSRYENTWDKINPGETRYSPEEALQYLRKSSLKPYIIQGLSRQPDWTIDYQVKMINYLITHGNFAPFPEIRPEREIPALTMRRIFDKLENKGVLEFDRSRKPYIVYLKDPGVNESINFERGLDPKASMGIGKASNPLIITSVEEEYWGGGRVQSNEDVEKADQNTWMNPIDDPVEIDYLFNNWEKTIDPFYGFWYQDPDDEEEYI